MQFRTSATVITASLFAFLLFAQNVSAQEAWSLQRCIEYARTNSIALKQAENSIQLSALTDKANHLSRLPSVSANSNFGYQFGRTIDPVSNDFKSQTIAFNSMGLNAGATVYSGGRINNTIKQGQINLQAAEKDAMASFNNIALSIATAYLNVLLSEEQLENANRRRGLSQQQLDQTDKRIAAGTLPANDRLDVLAQIANDEQAIIQAKNTIDINYLTLKGLMQLDPATNIKVERPNFTIPADANPDALDFFAVYAQAVNSQPQVAANELRVQSAGVGVDLAKAGYFPTLSIFGSLSSSWSDVAKQFEVVDLGTVRQSQKFYVDLGQGETELDVQYDVPNVQTNLLNYPYADQIKNNFGQSIGVGINIPIYSNGQNDINVQRAQLNILNAKLQSDQTKQQLKNDVQQAIASAKNARQTLDASQKSIDATKVAYENAEKRFQLGTINNLQLLTARNNYDIAQTNLTVSKYDYLFRLKILDYYLGKAIKLD
ncbi:MAG: TolC family protein [Saprospiraceae bacterium]|nr:TolC family protein [Saprospiraceae bacterium]